MHPGEGVEVARQGGPAGFKFVSGGFGVFAWHPVVVADAHVVVEFGGVGVFCQGAFVDGDGHVFVVFVSFSGAFLGGIDEFFRQELVDGIVAFDEGDFGVTVFGVDGGYLANGGVWGCGWLGCGGSDGCECGCGGRLGGGRRGGQVRGVVGLFLGDNEVSGGSEDAHADEGEDGCQQVAAFFGLRFCGSSRLRWGRRVHWFRWGSRQVRRRFLDFGLGPSLGFGRLWWGGGFDGGECFGATVAASVVEVPDGGSEA